jgi:hypothetical protein
MIGTSEVACVPFARRLRPAPLDGGFEQDGYWVWCGSAIRGDDGRYHLFAARWPRPLRFLPAYQSYSEIVRASSDTPEGPYRFEEIVLPDRGPAFWDGRMTHNPTVHKLGDRYLLFYIGTTFEGPKPTAEALVSGPDFYPWYRSIRIGVATAPSVLGPWQRPDCPLLLARPDAWDAHVVTNPAPCLAGDGRVLLYYRSYIPGRGNRIGLAIFEDLDRACTWRCDRPLFDHPEITLEDPYVFRVGDHFEMIAKDLNGKLCGELHAGIHLLSRDGVEWKLAPEPKAYSRHVRWSDGQIREMGCLERPQLLFDGGMPTHLFAAMGEGPTGKPGGFAHITRSWTGVVPLARLG